MTVRCKDCAAQGISSYRAAHYPGPRCTTHHREFVKRSKKKAHARRVEKGFGITGEQYDAIYASQGGKCYICQRATGKTKALAVDHDHKREGCLHAPDVGCPMCVRGLTCSTCNRIVLGRYDIHALARAIQYLLDPPAQKVLIELEEKNRTTR